MDAGEVWLADLGEERRRRVLVVSNRRFTSLSGRVLIAPSLDDGADPVGFPWRLRADDTTYALDFLRGIPSSRLLEHLGRVPSDVALAARRAIAHLT